MFCNNCGNQLKDSARFCPKCGTAVPPSESFSPQVASATNPQTGAPVPQPGPRPGFQPGPQPSATPYVEPLNAAYTRTINPNAQPVNVGANAYVSSMRPDPKKKIAITAAIAVVLLALIAVIVFAVVLPSSKAGHHDVTVTIAASGFDENDSRLPVQVTGTNESGGAVNELQFIAPDGTGLSLAPGAYQIEVLASPLTDDGTLYVPASEFYEINVPSNLGDGESYASTSTRIDLSPTDPTQVTDGQIDEATKYANQDSKFDKSKVDTYKNTATTVRQDAIDQQSAAESANKTARAERYKAALTTLLNSHVTPEGETLSVDKYGKTSENKFAIADVDLDGIDELVITWTSTIVADYVGLVYEFNPTTSSWICEFKGTPQMTFYTNGCLRNNLNHNQTYGTFWPCNIFQVSNNVYNKIHTVYSLDKSLAGKYETYPSEIDTENAGTVYHVDNGYVSKSTFENGVGQLINDNNEIPVTYYSLTSDNIAAISAN